MNTNINLKENISSPNTTTTNNVIDFENYKTTATAKPRQYILDGKELSYDNDLIFHLLQNSSIYNFQNESYNKYKENKDSEKGGRSMNDINWQDKYLSNLDNNIKEINQNLTNTENRISDMINKHIEYSTHLDKQRHEEILNLSNKIDTSISEISSKIDATNSNIDSTNKWIIGLVITTIVGVVGIVVAALSAIL